MGTVYPKLCCKKPPVVYCSEYPDGNKCFKVVCAACGKQADSSDREHAVRKFNA